MKYLMICMALLLSSNALAEEEGCLLALRPILCELVLDSLEPTVPPPPPEESN